MNLVAFLKSLGRPAPGAAPVALPPVRPVAASASAPAPTLRPFLDLVYTALAVLVLPFALVSLWRKPAYRRSLPQRLGAAPPRRAGVPRVWIHSVSVGEVNVARPLVEALARRHPDWDLVISTTTTSGQEVARKAHPARAVFFLPVDHSACVRRTLQRLRPDVIVLVELEVWPNHVLEAARAGVPVLIVNGRVTEDALRRYRWVIHPWRRVMGALTAVAAQNQIFAERLRLLGAPADRVQVTGNMKYDAVAIGFDPARAALLRTELGIAPADSVLIGGSTHDPEESHLLRALTVLLRDHPRLRLVLAPRHPERFDRVEAAIVAAGFHCLRRSRRQAFCDGQPAVLLLDTMGELRDLYAAADVVFVGGSLIPHGGQNILEPAALAKPVVHGPHMFNFADSVDLLSAAGGTLAVPNPEALPDALGALLRDPARAHRMGAAASAALVDQRGATERNLRLIEAHLPGRNSRAGHESLDSHPQ